MLTLLESRGACWDFSGCFREVLPSVALARKTQQAQPSQIQHMLAASPHVNSGFMFVCLADFYVRGDKRQLYDPQGLFRLLLKVTDLLPCATGLVTHQYALVSFMDSFDYAIKVHDLTVLQAV